MIFMLVICVTTDKRYSKVPGHLQPLYIGFTLLAIGVAYGSNGGYALNPVNNIRYLTSSTFVIYYELSLKKKRLAIWPLDWFHFSVDGEQAFSGSELINLEICETHQVIQICCNSFRDYNWFWIFLVGPHVGAILGVCIFHFLLKNASQDEIDSGEHHHDSPLVLVSTIETRPWMQDDRPCDVDHNKTKSEYNSYASMTL